VPARAIDAAAAHDAGSNARIGFLGVSAPALEELHLTLVLFGRCTSRKRAQIAPLTCLRIPL